VTPLKAVSPLEVLAAYAQPPITPLPPCPALHLEAPIIAVPALAVPCDDKVRASHANYLRDVFGSPGGLPPVAAERAVAAKVEEACFTPITVASSLAIDPDDA